MNRNYLAGFAFALALPQLQQPALAQNSGIDAEITELTERVQAL
jgi:hypothetical protein